MNFFQRRALLKKTNFLDLTPISIVSKEINDKHIVTLLVPRFKRGLAQKHIVPRLKNPNIRIKLDELGSATWLAIDGQKNVNEIVNALTLELGDKIQPATERITQFLSLSYQQKLITFKEIM